MGRSVAPLIIAGLLAGCASREPAPLLAGLEGAHRPASASDDAQRYFDQGLMLLYGFNHDEAARSFEEAAHLDPSCAMARWGVAYALGPNINLPLTDPAVARRAHATAQKALALAGDARLVDAALIRAMAQRFADPPPEDRKPLDEAYAAAMREVWEEWPEDPDVAFAFADALLNLRPWDQWQRNGRPQPGTQETVAVLERALLHHPDHPGLNHLYIHTIEASPNPERALQAAQRLEGSVPGAGHLLHMPAHIYLRTGRWADAVRVNEAAVEADRAYFARVGPQGIYEFYKAHNHHFIVYASMFLGNRDQAMRAAREGVAEISPQALERMAPFADGYLPMALHVMIRFGLWEDVLAEPPFDERFPIARATWNYARGVALANLDRLEEADAESRAFEEAAAAVPESARIVGTPARPVMEVAARMLSGEILFRKGRHDEAFAVLRAAVEKEDALPYDEPPGWMQPVRHALGALLLQVGRIDEAERVYREDLARHPGNGWALHGLAEALRRRGAVKEALEATSLFRRAWAHADVDITSSCYCRRP